MIPARKLEIASEITRSRKNREGGTIIKHKIRAVPNPLEETLELGGAYFFPNMRNSSINAGKEVNQALLGEITIQQDVIMFGYRHDCADFRGFDLSNGWGFATVSKRVYVAF